MKQQPIGIFDSGYGGLTVLKEITAKLPQYDYIYLEITGSQGRLNLVGKAIVFLVSEYC